MFAKLHRTFPGSLFYGSLALFSAATLLCCFWYFTVGINLWTSLLTVGILVTAIIRFGTISKIPLQQFIPETKFGVVLSGIGIFCFLTVIFCSLHARTGDAIVSPWNQMPFAIFPLYLSGLLCVILLGQREKNDAFFPLSILFLLTSTSISAIAFRHGFGFDPFLHRAAETALVQDGSIKPLQLLYSGQYAVVAMLHHVTQIPVKWIDIWFLPLLASWLLPLGIPLGLEDGWGLTKQEARTWWPVIFLIPFSLITFTVPFTVTYLFFFLFCALWPTLMKHESQKKEQLILLGSFFAVIFFHPLLAVPVFLFAVSIWSGTSRFIPLPTWLKNLLVLLVLVASVPLMLIASHSSLNSIHFASLVDQRELFFDLFRSPYWDPYPYIPWTLQFLYGFRYWLPMILFVGALGTLLFPRFRSIRYETWIFVLGIFLTIWGTATLFSFKDIIESEQSEFALRLLQALFTFPLPLFAVLLSEIVRRYRWPLLLCAFLVTTCVTVSWYFSYPQFNLKYPFFSPSVSDDDIAAVHAIDEDAHGEPYLVLVHQMTSAAAIQELGFDQMISFDEQPILRYPIPTGGILYPYYEDLIHHGVTRAKMDDLQQHADVKHIYVVTHDYWDWSEDMLQLFQKSADRHLREPGLTIWIYNYSSHP